MTKEEIQSAKSLCEKATEGPWKYGFGDGDESGLWSTTVFDTVREPTHEKEPRMIFYGTIDAASDSAFIAAARTLLPKALDALEEAHREIADLQTRLCNRMGCAHAVAFHLPGCPREQLATLGESTT